MGNAEKRPHRDLTAGTYVGDIVPKKTKFIYSWSGIFRDACYALVGTFLLQYTMLAGVLSSNPDTYTKQMNVITIALVVALIWDGLNDPIMGLILEKCHMKSGKFRPWILIGAIGNAVVVALMFAGFFSDWTYVIMMIVYYFLWDFVFTMNDIGYWSMLPSMTSDEKERSSLTTQMTLATTIGAFAMNAILMLVPGTGPSMAGFYRWAAIIVAILFLISQALIFFFCKEKQRDPKQDEISQKTKFTDMFTMLGKSKPLLMVVIAMLLYYIASGLITGIGLNYFYLTYGYGGNKGGFLAVLLSIVYVLATIVAQALYPKIAKKLKKQKILTITFFIIIASYVAFLFLAFPLFGDHPLAYSDFSASASTGDAIAATFSGTAWILFIPALLFFGASGLFYLVLLVMFQDSIEYNEWKNGERKESVAFSWRPLDAKFSSAAITGIKNATFIIAGLYVSAITAISAAEGKLNSILSTSPDHATAAAAKADCSTTIEGIVEGIKSSQLATVGYIIIGIIVVFFVAAYCCLHFGYSITEENYAKMVGELNLRHAKDEEEAKKKAPVPAVEAAAPAPQNPAK